MKSAAVRAGAAIVHHYSLCSIFVGAANPDVWLIHGEHFAVEAGSHQHQCAGLGSRIESPLDGAEVARTVGCNIQGFVL